MRIEEYGWYRITVDGAEHGHAFSRGGGGTRTAVVTIDGQKIDTAPNLSYNGTRWVYLQKREGKWSAVVQARDASRLSEYLDSVRDV